jgi:hypothetical protein
MGDADHEFGVMRRIAERCGQPLSYSLIQMPAGDPDAWRKSLAALSQATKDGLPMRAQIAPRPVGMLYGLELSFHPFAYHPSYKAISHLPLVQRLERMKDPVFREQLLSEQPEDTNPVNIKTVRAFQYCYAWETEANYEPQIADRIDRLAAYRTTGKRDMNRHGSFVRHTACTSGHRCAFVLCAQSLLSDRSQEPPERFPFQAGSPILQLMECSWDQRQHRFRLTRRMTTLQHLAMWAANARQSRRFPTLRARRRSSTQVPCGGTSSP